VNKVERSKLPYLALELCVALEGLGPSRVAVIVDHTARVDAYRNAAPTFSVA
jgi:hypothetical protein